MNSELAIYGGEKVKKTPFGTGKRFGEPEIEQLKEALEQNTLFYWHGKKVKEFASKFSSMYGSKYCVATSSGTAALHTALGALGITAGDEVITSPITDMGTVIGILYQNAIPVFADVDPHTYNLDPLSIEAKISPKTKAIIVVHLSGNPADMDAIMDIASRYGLKVVEDCAQSYLSYYKGKLTGTFGDIGCFSLNDFKHISAGDGGMCICHDDSLYEKMSRFADKNYNRLAASTGGLRRIESLAPNYRMCELQGAVAIAQLDRLEEICSRRNSFGDKLTEGISGLPGIYPHQVMDGCKSSWWFYMFRVDEKVSGVSRDMFSAALEAEGIPNSPGYIPNCIYENALFLDRRAYPGSICPFNCERHGTDIKYYKGMCPVAEEVLNTTVKLQVNEFYTEQDLIQVIEAINKISKYYNK